MGKVNTIESGTNTTITLNGNTGDISAGGAGQDGTIILNDNQGDEILRLGRFVTSPKVGASNGIFLKDNNQYRISLHASSAEVRVGGGGADGSVVVRDEYNKDRILLHGGSAQIKAGGNGKTGSLVLIGPDGKQRFYLGSTGSLTVGGNGTDGDIFVLPSSVDTSDPGDPGYLQKATISMDGDGGEIHLRSGGQNRIRLDGHKADAWLGGNGTDGDVVLFASGGDNTTPAKASIHLDGGAGKIRVGGPGVHGNLALFRADVIEADSNNFGKATIHLNGSTGDIILANADCAEDFDIAEAEEVEPGTVMVLDQEGKLQQSREAYDKKVAGVISGAGDYKPGIVLDKQHSQDKRLPVALMGKVYCKVDAESSPIAVGDLLTTSSTPGHAMKACDPLRAFGAVIGKALRPLAAGQGLIPILIALQ